MDGAEKYGVIHGIETRNYEYISLMIIGKKEESENFLFSYC